MVWHKRNNLPWELETLISHSKIYMQQIAMVWVLNIWIIHQSAFERRRRKLQNGIVPRCAHDAFAIKKICWRPKHSHSHTVHANVMKNLKCASFDNYRIESKPMKWKKKSGKMNIKPNCFIGMQWKEVSVVFNGTVSTWLWSSLISRS